jgi:hypothetical protein
MPAGTNATIALSNVKFIIALDCVAAERGAGVCSADASRSNGRTVLKSHQRPNSAGHVHARAIPNGADQNVGWMRVGMVAVMAKVIQFYVPDKLRERRLSNPPVQRGKVIQFPPTGNCTSGKLASPHLHREH